MILNDTHLAILRVLARSEVCLTTREIADLLPNLGRHLHQRNGGYPSVSTVKTYLRGLEWNDNAASLAKPVGIGPRSAGTWGITDEGRSALGIALAQRAGADHAEAREQVKAFERQKKAEGR